MADWGGGLGTSDSGLGGLGLGSAGVAGEEEGSAVARLATGTGVAGNASILVIPNAQSAAGTGTALDATTATQRLLSVFDRGTGTHGTAATSVTPDGRTATLAAGSMGVLVINTDNMGSGGAATSHPATATDSKGNVWTQRIAQVGDFGVAGAGFEYSFYTAPINVDFLTSDTLTLNFGVSPVVKVWTWYEVTSPTGQPPVYDTGGQIAAATAANASVTTGVIQVGNVTIAGYFSEQAQPVTPDSDTTNGTWTTQQTAQTGATTSGQRIATQAKVQITTPSTQTYNVTIPTGDRGAGYIVLRVPSAEVATGAGAANNARGLVAPRAEIATGTGQAYNATTTSSTASGAITASGTGSAANASGHVAPNAAHVTGSGTGLDAEISTDTVVFPEAAGGSGTSYGALSQIAPTAGSAPVTGQAYAPDPYASTLATGSFGLDAEITLPGDTHDRTLYHTGTQEDTTITTTEVLGPLPIGTTLDEVLAYLYGEVETLDTGTYFALEAWIGQYIGLYAVIQDETEQTFNLDAWIAGGASMTLSAIVKQIWVPTFGLDAVIHSPSEPWNLVRQPISGSATYTAISSHVLQPPVGAANGLVTNNFTGDGWRISSIEVGAIGDWWQVTWSVAQTIDRVVLYDGSYILLGIPNTALRFGNTGSVQFSDGSSVPYSGLNGTFLTLDFAPRSVTWLKVVSSTAGGSSCSLAEVEAYNTDQWEG